MIPDLNLTLDGQAYRYRIEVRDPDGDGRCEHFEIEALGLAPPVEGVRLTLDSTGRRTGPWR